MAKGTFCYNWNPTAGPGPKPCCRYLDPRPQTPDPVAAVKPPNRAPSASEKPSEQQYPYQHLRVRWPCSRTPLGQGIACRCCYISKVSLFKQEFLLTGDTGGKMSVPMSLMTRLSITPTRPLSKLYSRHDDMLSHRMASASMPQMWRLHAKRTTKRMQELK